MAPGGTMASDPCHKAWDAPGQEGRHTAPGSDHEHCGGVQGRSRVCSCPAVALACAAVARIGPSYEPHQGQADCADSPNGRDDCQDESGQGFGGPGLGMCTSTAGEVRAQAAYPVTRHGAVPFLSLGVPPAFLLAHLWPRPHERRESPAPRRQGGSGAAHGVCGQAPGGPRWEDGAPTEQEPTSNERPEQPA